MKTRGLRNALGCLVTPADQAALAQAMSGALISAAEVAQPRLDQLLH